jgi:O2-independent ubiquinone biosynthesis protein UbiU
MKTGTYHSTKAVSVPSARRLQLGCLAASPAAVHAAIDNGADWVRVPYKQVETRFDTAVQDFVIGRLGKAIRYAHHNRRKVVLDLSFPATPAMWPQMRKIVCLACEEGLDALMLSDLGLAIYSAIHHPKLALHFAVPSTVGEKAARQLQIWLSAGRILLPPMLSLARISELAAIPELELEVLGFGCAAHAVAPRTEVQRIGSAETFCRDVDDEASNDATYSSRRIVAGALHQLPRLAALGVRAIQIEPGIETPGDVAKVTRVWRTAIDRCIDDAGHYVVNPSWISQLDALHKAR